MPESNDPIEHYEEAEVRTEDIGNYTGETELYENWVHLPEWPIWIPREQVESVKES